MATEHEAAKGALSKPEPKKPESGPRQTGKPEVHVKQLDHGYNVEKSHPDGSTSQHSAIDLDDMVDHVIDHFKNGYAAVQHGADTLKHLNPFQEAADALNKYKGDGQ